MLDLKKRHGYGLVLEVLSVPGKRDVSGGKLLKVFEKVSKVLSDYYIHDSDWDWDGKKSIMWFNIDVKLLPRVKEVRGPPLKAKQNAAKFRKKHSDTFINEGRLFARDIQKKRDARQRVESALKENHLQGKFKKWKVKYYG